MSPRTPRLALLLAVPLFLLGCRSGHHGSYFGEHWGVGSVGQRISKHFTGYRPDVDESYIDYQYGKKKDINLTLRRHFANNNPDNPFQAEDPSRVQQRPPHSLLPDPVYYLHVESLAFGLVTLGWSGAFIPIPVDSLIATTTTGAGWAELWDGVANTFTGDTGSELASPPGTSKFKVKNR
jgi:hypothetical protein